MTRPKEGTMEDNVTLNPDQELYVLHHGDHITCLGFDVCLDRIERIVIELVGRGVLPGTYLDNEVTAVRAKRGTIEAYDTYENLRDRLKVACEEQHDRAICDLTPQLVGLEGWRVEVVDNEGDFPRRFIVGRSTGWMPTHLEISRRNAMGGGAAMREYRSVKTIEKVR